MKTRLALVTLVAAVAFSGAAMAGNVAVVIQDGGSNSSSITQAGHNNAALVAQDGFKNTSYINQDGKNNFAGVYQNGWKNKSTIKQTP